MNILRSRIAGPVLGLLAIFAVEIAIMAYLRATGRHLGLPLSLLTAATLTAPAFWLACVYWRRIDEAARDAQKTAWFWGGALGMAAGFVALSLYVRLGLVPDGIRPGSLLIYGALATVAFQLVGFHIAWAYWWWKRR